MGEYKLPHIASSYPNRPTSMPSARRTRVYGILAVLAIITLLYWSTSSSSSVDFYSKTQDGLHKSKPVVPAKAGVDNDKGTDEETVKMTERLQEAAKVAKGNANAKAPNKPDSPIDIIGKGNAANGAGVAKQGRRKGDGAQGVVKEETKEDVEVETELNSILKKSPIIIFSKSYCPHSKRAKDILLSKYNITPAPYVVELDLHPLGLNLQSRLNELTGRRTVPNVLVNGVSIGGGDDVAGLDGKNELISKVKEIGGKKIVKMELKEEQATRGL